MTHEQQVLIRYRLERATETIEEAKVMMQTGHPHGAANEFTTPVFMPSPRCF